VSVTCRHGRNRALTGDDATHRYSSIRVVSQQNASYARPDARVASRLTWLDRGRSRQFLAATSATHAQRSASWRTLRLTIPSRTSHRVLPQRPRNQELEDASWAALNVARPGSWVARRFGANDFGIDGEIEVFDAGGFTTGMKFAVQLKGTDEVDLSRALAVRIKHSTLRYLHSLDTPAHIFLYHAPSGALYGRWLHSFRVEPSDSQQTVTLRFVEENRWTSFSHEAAESTLTDLRAWKASDPPLPLTTAVTVIEPGPGITATALERQLRDDLAPISDFVRFTASAEDAPITATVAADAVTVDVLDMASFTWTHHHGDVVQGDVLSDSVHLLLGLMLDRTGKSVLAGKVLEVLEPRSPLILEFGTAFAVGSVLGYNRSIEPALRIAHGALVFGPTGFDAARAVEAGLRSSFTAADHKEGRLAKPLVAHYQLLIGYADSAGLSSGATHYSLAGLLFETGQYRQSLHHYRLAAVSDSAYRSRSYWWGQTGAALFELGRHRCAAAFYGHAQSMPDRENDHRARHADALLHAGAYNEAATLLSEYLSDSDEPAPWWTLKDRLYGPLCEAGTLPRSGAED